LAPLKPIDDLIIQVRRLISTVNAILDRYTRAYEEIDSIRLFQEELRSVLADHFQENTRWSDKLDRSLRELQRYVILIRATGGNQETLQIETKFSKAQIEDALKEELTNQQDLIKQYQKNVNMVLERIAKYGETIPLMNELEEYQNKIKKAQEAMARIREQLLND